MVWHPRGAVSFPKSLWKVGARVRMKRSGATGTVSYVVPARVKVSYGLRVMWDNGHEGRVVAPAFDLEPLA
jgi:hypothetical protein